MRFNDQATYDLAMGRAREEIAMKTAFYQGTLGLGNGGEWSADLTTGVIRFDQPTGRILTAPVQVVGTLDTLTDTWLWGWDHPSVPENVADHAYMMQGFGEEYGIEELTTRMIPCTEEKAWDLTALAVHLNDAQGGYRGPAGSTLIFMTFGEMTAYGPTSTSTG